MGVLIKRLIRVLNVEERVKKEMKPEHYAAISKFHFFSAAPESDAEQSEHASLEAAL